MSFQIHALVAEEFTDLLTLSDDELSNQTARRMVDAEVGETVIPLKYWHQTASNPYQAAHAIFVRKGARQAGLGMGKIPAVIRQRVIALRLFEQDHMMIDAEGVRGYAACSAITTAFLNRNVAYTHLHNAKSGCFAASVTRADRTGIAA